MAPLGIGVLRIWFAVTAVGWVVLLSAGPVWATPSSAMVRPPPVTDATPSAVSFGQWLGELAGVLDAARAPSVDAEYHEFVANRRLPAGDVELQKQYQRMRLLFEAIRDGGFWHLRWDITNQEPSSRLIWKRWIADPVRRGFAEPSATAECDESSALFGMLARHLQIRSVGLFYPTWNHTIAVWAPLAGKPKAPLVQLPTTQIFLDCSAGFDKTSFATQLRNIEAYPNWDVRPDTLVPRERADWLTGQLRAYQAASPALWSLMRAKRAYLMGSSMGPCGEARLAYRRVVAETLSRADQAALEALARDELGLEHPEPNAVLDWLAN